MDIGWVGGGLPLELFSRSRALLYKHPMLRQQHPVLELQLLRFLRFLRLLRLLRFRPSFCPTRLCPTKLCPTRLCPTKLRSTKLT